MKFRTIAVHRRPARRLRDVKMAGMSRKADDRLHLALSIQPATVSDISIPLGGFANIHVAHAAPALPGMPRTAQRIKSTPAVLLPRGGKVVLPGTGCTRECKCEPSTLLPALAAEPLLVELWHHDKYTQDVLLGVATIDLSEVLSARPEVDERGKTTHRQEQTVPFVAPDVEPPPLQEDPPKRASARHCALLDVVITLELKPPTPPPPPQPPQSQQQMMLSGAEQQAGVGGIYPLKAGSMTNQKAVSRTRGGASSGASADYATRQSAAVANLAAWRKREEEKFRQQLKEKEEEALKRLSREWALHENQRAAEARSQVRVVSAQHCHNALSLSLSLSLTHRSCALPC